MFLFFIYFFLIRNNSLMFELRTWLMFMSQVVLFGTVVYAF